MIPLCCSTSSGNRVLKLGARYDEKKKIFFIDNRHNRDKFKSWLPRYYRPSSSGNSQKTIKTYWMPCNSPVRNIKDVIGEEAFFSLKKKINEMNGHVCQFCGKKDNLWVVPVYRNDIDNKHHKLIQTLTSVMGGCSDCAKISLGIYLDKKHYALLNGVSEDVASREFLEQKTKNENCKFDSYEYDIQKINKLIGVK